MQITSATPRATYTIAGVELSVPQPFAEGHTLTAGEASALNQTFAENVRNNLASKAKDKTDKEGKVTAGTPITQEMVDAYAAGYEFGVRAAGGGSESRLSPVEREARRIAREKVEAKLREKGAKVSKENKDALIAQLAERPEIVKMAERRVREADKLSMDELGFDLPAADEAQPQAQAA
jgi:hypothetical protein